ncbi:hypothetical protein ACHAWF_002083 [Thalassiosira exigua]
MAGILFEFAMPAMRRGKIQPASKKMMPIPQSTRYARLRNMFERYRRYYKDPEFARYVREHHHDVANELAAACARDGAAESTRPCEEAEADLRDDRLVGSDGDSEANRDDSPAGAVEFDSLMAHYRCSQAIYDWMHSGTNSWLVGNFRRRTASHLWITSDDARRRDALMNVSYNSPLNEATKTAYGQDYELLITKRLKRLRWLCDEARNSKQKPKTKGGSLVTNLTLTGGDAEYLCGLYDLDNLEFSGKGRTMAYKRTGRKR